MLARREVLQKCLALGSIVIASDFSADAMLFTFQRAMTCCYTSLESMNMRSCALLGASDAA
jgi:hypothetical protein